MRVPSLYTTHLPANDVSIDVMRNTRLNLTLGPTLLRTSGCFMGSLLSSFGTTGSLESTGSFESMSWTLTTILRWSLVSLVDTTWPLLDSSSFCWKYRYFDLKLRFHFCFLSKLPVDKRECIYVFWNSSTTSGILLIDLLHFLSELFESFIIV